MVPNWDPHSGVKIRVKVDRFPQAINIQEELKEKGEARVTAEVNTGAEDVTELYFSNWKTL